MEPEFDLAPTRLVIRAAVTGSACILAHVRWRGRERPVPDIHNRRSAARPEGRRLRSDRVTRTG